MTTHDLAVFGRAEHVAHEWLDTVAAELGTDDRQDAYRVLRAWLHIVRDRLSADVAAHFAAQLPLLLRGVFYEGWAPSHVPVKYDAEQFLLSLGQEARISLEEARQAAGAVTAALERHCSPGQVEAVMAQLPHGLRDLLRPTGPGTPHVPGEGAVTGKRHARPSAEERIARVERDVETIIDAVRALLQGIEELPTEEPSAGRAAHAARHAHQILLAAGANRATSVS